jgi:hypothetical protein
MFESHPTEAACKAGHKESPGLISLVFVGGKGTWDSLVGITTRCGLDSPGIESVCGGEFFRTRPDRLWGPNSLLYNG